MADEEQVVDAPVAPVGRGAKESVVVDAATAAPPKLRIKPSDSDAADDEIGAPPVAVVTADDEIGQRPSSAGRFKLAGLFGGANATDDDDAMDDGAKWAGAPAPERPRRQGSGIRLVNRFLAAAIVLILVFGVLDLFATSRWQSSDGAPIDRMVATSDGATARSGNAASAGGVPPLAKLLDSFQKRPIIRDLEKADSGATTIETVTERPKVPDWKLYAQHLDLIGFSGAPGGGQEAIVADRKTGRTHFLQLEQEMTAGESQLKLIRVAADHVVFTKDGEELTVK